MIVHEGSRLSQFGTATATTPQVRSPVKVKAAPVHPVPQTTNEAAALTAKYNALLASHNKQTAQLASAKAALAKSADLVAGLQTERMSLKKEIAAAHRFIQSQDVQLKALFGRAQAPGTFTPRSPQSVNLPAQSTAEQDMPGVTDFDSNVDEGGPVIDTTATQAAEDGGAADPDWGGEVDSYDGFGDD